jgi:prolipoprotein diacylglyceryltransferase
VEGSPQLQRPFGYFGAVAGVVCGSIAGPLFGLSPWLMLGAFSVAAPWIQAIGRLRCLVQGCCHGSPAPEHAGIRYTNPMSRVFRLAGLAGVPVHPTPLYSVLWNLFTGLAVGRLWTLHASLPLIAGLYLILMGTGRFVEEAYRGEPQTPVLGGLRLYQWLSIAAVLIGVGLTALPGPAAAGQVAPAMEPVVTAAIFGVLCWFALGVDFPESNHRFARLT